MTGGGSNGEAGLERATEIERERERARICVWSERLCFHNLEQNAAAQNADGGGEVRGVLRELRQAPRVPLPRKQNCTRSVS